MADHTMFKSVTPYAGPAKPKEVPSALTLDLDAAAAAPAKAANPNRCGTCRKKLTLTYLESRCKVRFCAAHRMPEEHACTFDFKSHGIACLEKQLTKAVANKVERF